MAISVGRGLNMPADGVPPNGNEARDFATFYLPYAVMAELANNFNGTGGCPKLNWQDHKRYLAGWRCHSGWMDEIPGDEWPGTWRVPGLGVFLWQRNSCELAVVFRGTNFHELADWKSNLRWLLPFSITKDQYDYVQYGIKHVIAHAGCGGRRSVVMVGHSLGGGLAQVAAFATPGTKYVFAFDSSPVTGWLEQDPKTALENNKHLPVDRIYEVGEILQAARFVLQGFSNPRSCQPRTRLVRFNHKSGGSPVSQHGIEELKKSFIELSGATKTRGPIGDINRADGRLKARTCDFQDDFRNDPYRVDFTGISNAVRAGATNGF